MSWKNTWVGWLFNATAWKGSKITGPFWFNETIDLTAFVPSLARWLNMITCIWARILILCKEAGKRNILWLRILLVPSKKIAFALDCRVRSPWLVRKKKKNVNVNLNMNLWTVFNVYKILSNNKVIEWAKFENRNNAHCEISIDSLVYFLGIPRTKSLELVC